MCVFICIYVDCGVLIHYEYRICVYSRGKIDVYYIATECIVFRDKM
jgi:hypothetical protein